MVGPPHPTVWGCAGAKPQGHRMAVHFYVRDVFRQTVQTLWSHKLRSFLTMFGITWGVMSLLLLGSVGEGFRIGQRQRLSQLGTDLVFVFGGRVSPTPRAGQTEPPGPAPRENRRPTRSESPLGAPLPPDTHPGHNPPHAGNKQLS